MVGSVCGVYKRAEAGLQCVDLSRRSTPAPATNQRRAADYAPRQADQSERPMARDYSLSEWKVFVISRNCSKHTLGETVLGKREYIWFQTADVIRRSPSILPFAYSGSGSFV